MFVAGFPEGGHAEHEFQNMKGFRSILATAAVLQVVRHISTSPINTTTFDSTPAPNDSATHTESDEGASSDDTNTPPSKKHKIGSRSQQHISRKSPTHGFVFGIMRGNKDAHQNRFKDLVKIPPDISTNSLLTLLPMYGASTSPVILFIKFSSSVNISVLRQTVGFSLQQTPALTQLIPSSATTPQVLYTGDVDCCRVTPSKEYERLSGASAIPRAYYREIEDFEPELYPAIDVLTDIEDDDDEAEEDANTNALCQ
ncbi:hypothetical protein C8J57DRAFT_1257843 [Mycena rebaudengoi]|nr:hypothetical protein C8J57DRAFT_1257843 [Mycena rebaudengoi]